MELDVRQVLQYARRWWWLLLLAPLVVGLTAQLVGTQLRDRPLPTYTAHATLLIAPDRASGLPSFNPRTYAELVTASDVLQPVAEQLDSPATVNDLRRTVWAEPLRDADLLTVYATDVDPERAADIANGVATSFIDYVAKRTVQLNDPYRGAIIEQIAVTEEEINAIAAEIEQLDRAPNSRDPAVETRIDTLSAQLRKLQDAYADLQLTAQNMDLNAVAVESRITMAEPAEMPTIPNPVDDGLPAVPIGAMAGLLLAGVVIILFERLDDSVRVDANFQTLVGAPLLSVIPRVRKLRAGYEQLYILQRSNSPAAEALRLLRTNVEFSSVTDGLTSIAITSPNPREGKSTITANLGVSIAQAGTSVVIIDGDLRRPSQHRIFDIPNTHGLTTLLSTPGGSWQDGAVKTNVRNLSVIPSGPSVPSPGDLLSTDSLPELLAEIGQSVEVILIDTPPVLTGSDAIVVGANVDGVIVAARAGQTRIEALRSAAGALKQGTANIIGAVVNQQPAKDSSHRYYFRQEYDGQIGIDASVINAATARRTWQHNGHHNGAWTRVPKRPRRRPSKRLNAPQRAGANHNL